MLTKVQKQFYEDYIKGLGVEDIASKYAIVPVYVERELNIAIEKIRINEC